MNPWGTPQWIGSDEEKNSPIDTEKTCEPHRIWTMTETNSVLQSRWNNTVINWKKWSLKTLKSYLFVLWWGFKQIDPWAFYTSTVDYQ